MAALTDLSDLINRSTGGNSGTPESIWFHKVPRVAGAAAASPVAGRMVSLWEYAGSPSHGDPPTTAVIPTNSTDGALKQTNPGGSRQKWLIHAGAASSQGGTLILYDRIFHIGNLSGTSTADQTIQGASPSPALTRDTEGVGNFMFYEIYSAIGSTSTTLTVTYTNTANASKTATVNIGGTGFNGAQRAQFIPLASGDVGVKAVEKVKLTATTGIAGNFGFVIGNPIAYLINSGGGSGSWRDFSTGLPSIPEIPSNACLALLWIPNATVAPDLAGCVSFVEK